MSLIIEMLCPRRSISSMEIKLTIELARSKDADRNLVLAVAEEVFRPLVEELKEAGSKVAYPLVSAHSDWAIAD